MELKVSLACSQDTALASRFQSPSSNTLRWVHWGECACMSSLCYRLYNEM